MTRAQWDDQARVAEDMLNDSTRRADGMSGH